LKTAKSTARIGGIVLAHLSHTYSSLIQPAPAAEDTILSEDKAAAVMRSEEFMSFFERSTRLVERALNQPYDFAVDYAARGDDERWVRLLMPT
jgi:hypothetical protein